MLPGDTVLFRRAARMFLLITAGVALWLSFKYLLPVALPFLIAWLLSLAIRPVVDKLAGKRNIPRKIVTGVLVVLFVSLLIFGVVKGCERAVGELGRFVAGLSSDEQGVGFWLSKLSDKTASWAEHLPFLHRFADHPAFSAFCEGLDSTIRAWARSALDTLGQKIPAALMTFIGQLPSVLIFVTSLLLSCYYFCAHPLPLGERLQGLLPESWRSSFNTGREKMKRALTGYIRAYVILGLLTFGEMFLGLSLIRVSYSFLMAFIIALVDFLPLLGAGAVLVPWAMICLFTGNGRTATGLLIIFGVHTLLRQILEPRLVSHELGLSPLASLVAVYAGWRLMGLGGLIAAPLLLMIVKELLQSQLKTPSRT